MVNYTLSNREDGCWDVEWDEGSIEVAMRRHNGSLRPICKVEDPDMPDDGECGGNLALIATAPKMYRTILELEKLLRFLIIRSTSTEAERAEYRSHLLSVDESLRAIGAIEENLKVEANFDHDD